VTASELVRAIGVSHLLQPPLTLLLAGPRGVNLRADLLPATSLAREVLTNMAVASVLLPTTLGLLLTLYPTLALEAGPTHILALLLSAFWCWRLYRQLFVLGPLWPRAARSDSWLNALLTLIFAVQGPGLWLLVAFR
jgi:hypothetical protein